VLQMGRIIVQIYEIQSPKEAERLIDLGVDHIGSVLLSERDWKVPAIKETISFCKKSQVKNCLIPLFRKKETILRVIEYYQPHIIHFCDALIDDNGCMKQYDSLIRLQMSVKEGFPDIEIMRSLPLPPRGRSNKVPTLEIAKCFESSSDYFLVDTWLGRGPVEGFIGLTGRICNWEMARRLVKTSSIPVILAGGISPKNVYNGLLAVKPFGVDSCSKTNELNKNGKSIRFKKDYEKVKKFIQEVRRAEKDIFGI